MQIAVPDNIAAAALGGDTSVLGEVADAYAALKDAQSRAQAALLPDIAQVLADGLARPKATNGENAQMLITEDGQMVVMLGEHEEEPETPAATPAPAPKSNGNGTTKRGFPSIGELRKRAAACGADISDLAPQAKADILARIEAAEAAAEHEALGVSEPETTEETTGEPAEEIAAESEPETDPEPETPEEETTEPEEEPEDDGLGLDDSPDEEPVESPENDEGAEPITPPSDDDLDVDDWLE